MYENIENKWLFLLENYYNSLGIKGFIHNYTNSLRTASVYSTKPYAKPCISKKALQHVAWKMVFNYKNLQKAPDKF